jgi:hypothetical protein
MLLLLLLLLALEDVVELLVGRRRRAEAEGSEGSNRGAAVHLRMGRAS